jgi:hypothetical protein
VSPKRTLQVIKSAHDIDPQPIEAMRENIAVGIFVGRTVTGSVTGVLSEIIWPENGTLTTRITTMPANSNTNSGYPRIVEEVEALVTLRARKLASQYTNSGIAATDMAMRVERYVRAVRDWRGDPHIGGRYRDYYP